MLLINIMKHLGQNNAYQALYEFRRRNAIFYFVQNWDYISFQKARTSLVVFSFCKHTTIFINTTPVANASGLFFRTLV